jgi:outer membrane PBP1 activator LpoA protein
MKCVRTLWRALCVVAALAMPAQLCAQADAPATSPAAAAKTEAGVPPPAAAFGPRPSLPINPKPKYGLVLPLESPAFAGAAAAVKAGFLAAAEAGGEKGLVLGFTHGDGNVAEAYELAASSGAAIVVGPLARDDLRRVLGSRSRFPLTLALNQPDESEVLPRNVYSYVLSIEGEGRQLARLMQQQGRQRVAIVADTGPLQKRLEAAFTQEWEHLGGTVAGLFPYYSDPAAIRGTRSEIDKVDPDCLFLALDSEQARQVRGYLSTRPAYASSLVYDGPQSFGYRELDNVRFVEIPWLVQPDHAAVMAYPRAALRDPSLERLYALGIDAYRLARQLAAGEDPGNVTLDGVTGQISGAVRQRFAREEIPMLIRNGDALLAESARTP